MASTQFAMAEDMASLIKDNLMFKHLVLSTEEILVNFLETNSSLDGVLELQPMSPYHHLLLHRLADIYGFTHQSVGEGDDRHLVLERCPESAIPPILVSDILWQNDNETTVTSHDIFRRELPVKSLTESLPTSIPLEQREAAYLAARERIFSSGGDYDAKEDVARRPRGVPVVAQRMICHALGQKRSPSIFSGRPSSSRCEEPSGGANARHPNDDSGKKSSIEAGNTGEDMDPRVWRSNNSGLPKGSSRKPLAAGLLARRVALRRAIGCQSWETQLSSARWLSNLFHESINSGHDCHGREILS